MLFTFGKVRVIFLRFIMFIIQHGLEKQAYPLVAFYGSKLYRRYLVKWRGWAWVGGAHMLETKKVANTLKRNQRDENTSTSFTKFLKIYWCKVKCKNWVKASKVGKKNNLTKLKNLFLRALIINYQKFFEIKNKDFISFSCDSN